MRPTKCSWRDSAVDKLDAAQRLKKGFSMWYFSWVLGVGFAVLLAVMNAMWGENEAARARAASDGDDGTSQ